MPWGWALREILVLRCYASCHSQHRLHRQAAHAAMDDAKDWQHQQPQQPQLPKQTDAEDGAGGDGGEVFVYDGICSCGYLGYLVCEKLCDTDYKRHCSTVAGAVAPCAVWGWVLYLIIYRKHHIDGKQSAEAVGLTGSLHRRWSGLNPMEMTAVLCSYLQSSPPQHHHQASVRVCPNHPTTVILECAIHIAWLRLIGLICSITGKRKERQ